MTGFDIAVLLEMLDKVIIGNFTSFFKSVQSIFDF